MGALDGRVAIITGAGRGLGREHALLFAREGARVVVNDLGGGNDGAGADASPAHEVVAEIKQFGGEAVANTDSVADWAGAARLVHTAVETFGDLHVLVNNAGIIRDRMLVNMTEDDWDLVVKVHLKGTFAPTRHAANYWRERTKAGEAVAASIINTSSMSGLMNNVGQSNYGAAKSGIVAFSQIVAKELARYGVRVNAITPNARTRLTMSTPGLEEMFAAPDDDVAFDPFDPGHISPLVAYLATEACPYTGGVWNTNGGIIGLFEGWRVIAAAAQERRWEIGQLAQELPRMIGDRAFSDGRLLSEGMSMQEAFETIGTP